MQKKTNSLDKENLRQVILDFPQQFKQGLAIAKDIKIDGNFKSIEVSGMGGSSLPANILRVYLNSIHQKKSVYPDFNIFQNRFYSLPIEAHSNCLNFFASYSGNTEETLSSLKEAIRLKLPCVGFATGGKLLSLCNKHGIPCVILPDGIQPRYATGYFFSSMLQILINSKMIPDKSAEIIRLTSKLKNDVVQLESAGKKLAQKLIGKTPVIYASAKYKSLAMIWKIKINENAKTPAFYNFYPELNHNEMVGYTLPQGKFHIINLLDTNDHPQNIKRMHTTSKILNRRGISFSTIEIDNSSVFSSIFSTLILGDWTSYYLALAYKQDPTPVDMVEDLKKQLS